MSIVPFAVIWACLALALLGILVYRKLMLHEDDFVHLSDGEAKAISQQAAVAHKLDVVDRWVRILTTITLATGVLLAGAFLYQLWNESAKLGR